MARDNLLQTTVDLETKQLITRTAQSRNLSVAELSRQYITKGLQEDVHTVEDFENRLVEIGLVKNAEQARLVSAMFRREIRKEGMS